MDLLKLGLIVVGIVALFAVLYWLSVNIEPNDRKTENDDHMKGA